MPMRTKPLITIACTLLGLQALYAGNTDTTADNVPVSYTINPTSRLSILSKKSE